MGLDLRRCPISSPSHTSTKNGEFTSQSTRTRLYEMQCAEECKTYEFSWFRHSYTSSQYDSIPCNHHVNTSILQALTYPFFFFTQFMLFNSSNIMQATHMDNFSPKITSRLCKTVPHRTVNCPRTVPSSCIWSISWDWNAWPFSAS